MADHTRSLNPNTVAFACLEPQVAVLINDIIHAVSSVLGWRQSSKSLLIEILSRLAEGESFEQTHIDFSAALWPHQDEARRKEKFSRWLAKLKEDMKLSKFQPVWVESRRPTQKPDGGYIGLPTRYNRADFWKLFRAVQDYALKCDLLTLTIRKRRAEVRVIVAAWLTEAGAETIERQKETEDTKPAKTSPPCRCNCASCLTCAAKSATNGEAAARRIEELRRQPNEDFNVWLEGISEEYYRRLIDTGEVGSEYRFRIKRALHALEIAEQRAREMITTENKRESTREYIKLIGGQPK